MLNKAVVKNVFSSAKFNLKFKKIAGIDDCKH
jgi:hypothetical protein